MAYRAGECGSHRGVGLVIVVSPLEVSHIALVVVAACLIFGIRVVGMGMSIRNIAILSFRNKTIKTILLTLVSAFKSIPTVLVGLLFASFFGGNVYSVTTALMISCTFSSFRVLETKVKEIEGEEYITALDALGLKKGRIIFFHILPSLFSIAREEWATTMMTSILSESALSFLGIGIDRSIPTLGALLSEARSLFFTKPHLLLFPSLFLVMIGVLVMIIKSGLSELDPSSH